MEDLNNILERLVVRDAPLLEIFSVIDNLVGIWNLVQPGDDSLRVMKTFLISKMVLGQVPDTEVVLKFTGVVAEANRRRAHLDQQPVGYEELGLLWLWLGQA